MPYRLTPGYYRAESQWDETLLHNKKLLCNLTNSLTVDATNLQHLIRVHFRFMQGIIFITGRNAL